MRTYCLFCETVKCDYVASSAEKLLECRAISPKRVQHTRIRGEMVDRMNDLLPGYVFLYLEDDELDVFKARSINGVIKCLGDREHGFELQGSDEQFALMLLNKGGVIGRTKVYQEGQLIKICKGSFAGVEARILKVEKRYERMLIEIPFAGRPVKTWVEYEVVSTDEPEIDEAYISKNAEPKAGEDEEGAGECTER